MLARGFRFAGQIGTLGKVESASIRATATASAAAAAKNEEMIVPGGVSFVIVIVFYLIFWRGGEPGKIATKANRHAIESLLSSHRRAVCGAEGSRKMCKLFFTVHCNKSMSRGNRLSRNGWQN